MSALFFVNRNLGFASGERGPLLKTTDGGVTWIRKALDTNGANIPVQSFSFVDGKTGYAAGNFGYVYRTRDSGETWGSIGYNWRDDLYAVYFKNQDTGFVAGGGGLIRRTTDAGAHWVQLPTGATAILFEICFPNPDTGYAVGNSGTIVKTVDGGATWALRPLPDSGHLYTAAFLDGRRGFVAGNDKNYYRGFWETNDGGDHWSAIPVPKAEGFLAIQSIRFCGRDSGFLVTYDGMIAGTIDGGRNWYRSRYPAAPR